MTHRPAHAWHFGCRKCARNGILIRFMSTQPFICHFMIGNNLFIGKPLKTSRCTSHARIPKNAVFETNHFAFFSSVLSGTTIYNKITSIAFNNCMHAQIVCDFEIMMSPKMRKKKPKSDLFMSQLYTFNVSPVHAVWPQWPHLFCATKSIKIQPATMYKRFSDFRKHLKLRCTVFSHLFFLFMYSSSSLIMKFFHFFCKSFRIGLAASYGVRI